MAVVTGAKNKISVRIGRGAALAILIFLSVLVLIPLVWTICMSVKPDGEIYNGGGAVVVATWRSPRWISSVTCSTP